MSQNNIQPVPRHNISQATKLVMDFLLTQASPQANVVYVDSPYLIVNTGPYGESAVNEFIDRVTDRFSTAQILTELNFDEVLLRKGGLFTALLKMALTPAFLCEGKDLRVRQDRKTVTLTVNIKVNAPDDEDSNGHLVIIVNGGDQILVNELDRTVDEIASLVKEGRVVVREHSKGINALSFGQLIRIAADRPEDLSSGLLSARQVNQIFDLSRKVGTAIRKLPTGQNTTAVQYKPSYQQAAGYVAKQFENDPDYAIELDRCNTISITRRKPGC
ncbi:MAG: hypothetical protein K2X29_01010 [Candidatus Obscuribacterales bacterium]|nr:hypothetical protein [Candidatus Obscuribacterales bacterium]